MYNYFKDIKLKYYLNQKDVFGSKIHSKLTCNFFTL